MFCKHNSYLIINKQKSKQILRMGSFASKTWNEMCDYYNDKEFTPQVIPDMRPKQSNDSNAGYDLYLASDPRSPSTAFDRTPIQMFETRQKTINYDDSDICVTPICDQMAVNPDPRSPTAGIDRTPIGLPLSQSSIVAQMSAMRLSFGSIGSDSINNSSELQTNTDNCDSITKLDTNETNNCEKQGRVRTPLASVQQKQTPIPVRQRKSLNVIEKRAHFNSLLLRNKPKADNKENNLVPTHVSHDKENL